MRRLFRWVVLVIVGLVLLPYVLTPLYSAGHPVSTLMVIRTWMDIDTIAPALPRSVVAAEDAKFCFHSGIDWDSVQDVLEDAQDGEVSRGGSTITQQVAKNLFLWPGRSFVRKALEFPLALWIDYILPKKRILELYLNVAELGPAGQFGADAGARYAFGRPASALSAHEAALLASILPNPVTRSARKPGPGVRRLASTYALRARSAEISDCWGRNR